VHAPPSVHAGRMHGRKCVHWMPARAGAAFRPWEPLPDAFASGGHRRTQWTRSPSVHPPGVPGRKRVRRMEMHPPDATASMVFSQWDSSRIAPGRILESNFAVTLPKSPDTGNGGITSESCVFRRHRAMTTLRVNHTRRPSSTLACCPGWHVDAVLRPSRLAFPAAVGQQSVLEGTPPETPSGAAGRRRKPAASVPAPLRPSTRATTSSKSMWSNIGSSAGPNDR
jgi:hypothetical protein